MYTSRQYKRLAHDFGKILTLLFDCCFISQRAVCCPVSNREKAAFPPFLQKFECFSQAQSGFSGLTPHSSPRFFSQQAKAIPVIITTAPRKRKIFPTVVMGLAGVTVTAGWPFI